MFGQLSWSVGRAQGQRYPVLDERKPEKDDRPPLFRPFVWVRIEGEIGRKGNGARTPR